jgi:glycosyl transferase family 25
MAFERFPAIDGKLVPEDQLAAERAAHFELQPINRFETALFLSHRAVWQKFVDGGEPACAVFEDDVVLAPEISAAFELISACSEPFDVVKLETTGRKVIIANTPTIANGRFFLAELKSWHGGAAGYVLSRRGALKLLEKNAKVADPVDQVIFNPQSSISRSLDILQLVPAVAIQAQFLPGLDMAVPQTTAGRDATHRFGIRHGLWVDLRRAFKRLGAGLRMRQLAKRTENRQLRVDFTFGASANKPVDPSSNLQADRA